MLVPILRAAHCRSTHHFFAIDALERIGTERGKRLAELLLKPLCPLSERSQGSG